MEPVEPTELEGWQRDYRYFVQEHPERKPEFCQESDVPPEQEEEAR